jgi:hypothetical protein
LSVRFPRPLPRSPATLLWLGTGARQVRVTARGSDGGLVLSVVASGRTLADTRPLSVPAAPAPIVVSIDPLGHRYYASVHLARHRVLTTGVSDVRGAVAVVGPGVAAKAFRAPVCRRVARRAGLL